MRVKLHFEDFPASSNNRKVCFLVDKESCKRVTDLCYLIKEQYYSSNGIVSLYLDGFYFPSQESINIIQENDTLNVRFSGYSIKEKSLPTSGNRKRKAEQSSSDSSLSTNTEGEVNTETGIKKTVARPQKCARLTSASKLLPLSKLGFRSNQKKKEVEESSSSSSSSSDSDSNDSSDKEERKIANSDQKATHKIPSVDLTKQLSNHVFVKPTLIKTNVKKSGIAKKKTNKSSSSSDSSSSDSSEDEKTESKIDFDISNLSKKAISTPFPTPPVFLSSSNQSIKTSKADLCAKKLPKKDNYKNTSQILTSKPWTPNTSETNIEEKLNCSVETNIRAEGNTSEFKVSGKTLRNRRRRQKRLELARNKAKKQSGEGKLDDETEKVDTTSYMTENNLKKGLGNAETLSEITPQPAGTRDYSTYPKLVEPPSVGSLIAYKVIEMSFSYTPEMSEFKEAVVNSHNKETNVLELKLSSASLHKARGDGNVTGRFELPMEQDEDKENTMDDIVLVNWSELCDVRLIL
ncbi:coilin-like [Hydractinia symbiolongicarpus]|uniref:coilin-like n=1 Tax=Hydractinia symbiolongicarpus TaxID=13093 RepID=UPI00254A6D26|nr:coilin-like [Hydractinia symbiolongicarpus]